MLNNDTLSLNVASENLQYVIKLKKQVIKL